MRSVSLSRIIQQSVQPGGTQMCSGDSFQLQDLRVLRPFRELTDPCKGPQFGAETWLPISQLMSENFRTVLERMKILCLLFGQQTVKTMDPRTSEYPPGISCYREPGASCRGSFSTGKRHSSNHLSDRLTEESLVIAGPTLAQVAQLSLP